MVLVSERTYQ